MFGTCGRGTCGTPGTCGTCGVLGSGGSSPGAGRLSVGLLPPPDGALGTSGTLGVEGLSSPLSRSRLREEADARKRQESDEEDKSAMP